MNHHFTFIRYNSKTPELLLTEPPVELKLFSPSMKFCVGVNTLLKVGDNLHPSLDVTTLAKRPADVKAGLEYNVRNLLTLGYDVVLGGDGIFRILEPWCRSVVYLKLSRPPTVHGYRLTVKEKTYLVYTRNG